MNIKIVLLTIIYSISASSSGQDFVKLICYVQPEPNGSFIKSSIPFASYFYVKLENNQICQAINETNYINCWFRDTNCIDYLVYRKKDTATFRNSKKKEQIELLISSNSIITYFYRIGGNPSEAYIGGYFDTGNQIYINSKFCAFHVIYKKIKLDVSQNNWQTHDSNQYASYVAKMDTSWVNRSFIILKYRNDQKHKEFAIIDLNPIRIKAVYLPTSKRSDKQSKAQNRRIVRLLRKKFVFERLNAAK